MRRRTMTRLVLLALAAPIAVHSAAYAGKDNKQPAPAGPTFTKEVEGKARASRDEAIESALQIACTEIAAYLQEQKPPLIWQPDPAYVREHLLVDVPKVDEEQGQEDGVDGHRILVRKEKFGVDGIEFTHQVRLRVSVTPQELARMRQLDQPFRDELRHATIHERQLWLGKILLGVVVFLCALSGYIRLEDATKGYYTGWLRLGLVGVISAVGAGLWLAS